jgi:MFS family permease
MHIDTSAGGEAPGTLDLTEKLVILSSGLLSSLCLTAITSVLPSIASALAHGPTDAMLVKQLIGAVTLAMAIGAPTGGYFADRMGLRPVLFSAALVYTITGTAGLYLNSLWLLLGSRLLLGLAAATIQVLGLTMVNTKLAGNARAKWMGLHFSVAILGTLFIIPIAGKLGDISWRLPFAMYFAGLLLVMGLLLHRSDEAVKVTATASTAAAVLGAPAKPTGFPWHYLPFGFVLGVLTFLPTIAIPFQLRQQDGASPSTIAYVMTGTAAVGAVMGFLYGRARRRLSTHAVFLVSLALNCVGAYIASHSSGFDQVLIGLFIMCLGSSWFPANIMTAVGSKVTLERQGRAAGLIKAAQFLAAPVAVAVVQPFVKRYGEVIALQAVAVIGFGMFIVMVLRIIHLRRAAEQAVKLNPSEQNEGQQCRGQVIEP